MSVPALSRRVDNLSTKLVEEPKEHIARFDDASFTEAERLLFQRIEELQAKHGDRLTPQVLEANKDLIFKAQDILFKYSVETFKFAMYCFMGNPDSQRDKNLFDLFFYSFMLDARKCLKEAQLCQSEEEFWKLFEKYDLFSKLSHLMGTPNNTEKENQDQDLDKTEYSDDKNNEHYDRV